MNIQWKKQDLSNITGVAKLRLANHMWLFERLFVALDEWLQDLMFSTDVMEHLQTLNLQLQRKD